MILEKYIGKKVKLYFEDEWQPHHFSSSTIECNLLGADEQGVLIGDDKGKIKKYFPFLLRYQVIVDINSDVHKVELKADTEKAESSNFESNDIDTMSNDILVPSAQTLKRIFESLSQLKALAMTLQIAHADIRNEQPLFQEMLDNISNIRKVMSGFEDSEDFYGD